MEEIVLATLNCATTIMSMETQVSNIYLIIFSLLKTHLLRSEDDSRRVGQFKSKVRQSLSTRMGVDTDDLVSKPSLIASIFDPRHKHLRFLTPMERAAAKEKLQEIVTTLEVTTDVPITDKPAAAATSGDEETAVPAAPLLLPGSTDLPDTNKKGRGTLPPTFLQHHVPLQRSVPILYPTLLPHPATEDPPTITNG
ncbi:hypothetical protein AAFF_G00334120 [Aldrovandia affinis]|uniref:Uncharacterized protein n=1 Tax=Aldrovandia affinis TaxID=143900 RepID=A0AAD7R6L0_9TELE|nr:hypothetical protein AAFF_G00334120 [Aldrovandia affinis]